MIEYTAKIFISYSWKTQEIAEKIYLDLNAFGITILKDNHELRFTDKISSFMDSIRNSDYLLLLISDSYLKSKNCMYEVTQLLKEKEVWNKIIPIVLPDTQIYTPKDRISYLKYWQLETNSLERELETVDPINAIEILKDIKVLREITATIDLFIKQVSDLKHISPEVLFEEGYQPIFEKIGYNKDQHLSDLLRIIQISDPEVKEIELENYFLNYGSNFFFLLAKAGYYNKQKRFILAKLYYEKVNMLVPLNIEAQNNLGQIYENITKEYEKAKQCYQMAIIANPRFDIPRLNLGVLLNRYYKDEEGAKEQYEFILSFDPDNAKAHNNLANYYKSIGTTHFNPEKAEYHFLEALKNDPLYIEAYIGYGNFLKVIKHDIKKGNYYYQEAKNIDSQGYYTEFIDQLLSSDKG